MGATVLEVAGLPDYQSNLKNPDFAKLAEAIGMMGERIESQPVCPPA
jgi:pyruvate dehydrogenase (quinone)